MFLRYLVRVLRVPPRYQLTSPSAFLSQVSRCQQRSGSRWWSHTIVDLSTKQPVPQLPKDALSESAIFRKMHFFLFCIFCFFFAVYRQFLFEKTFNSVYLCRCTGIWKGVEPKSPHIEYGMTWHDIYNGMISFDGNAERVTINVYRYIYIYIYTVDMHVRDTNI